jgi:xanthine dehydrogenase small subunit
MGGEAHAGAVEFLLNGTPVRAEGYPPQTTLLDFVRARGLTGAKEGCAEGECGACTVLMVKPCGERSEYVPINGCLMFLPMAAGQEIVTVEGLAENGALAPAQEAMAAAGGSQCGYCTPGFVMSLAAEHYRRGREGPCEWEALGGNLCRCTGYRPIRDAAASLGDVSLPERLSRLGPAMGAMSCHGFHRPATLRECFDLLARYPAATLVAGGTDLAVESNLRGRRFARLISLEALDELRLFRESAGEVEIGAGLTLSEIDARWENAPPVWRDWLRLFASPLIRNRATLGGNLATASPIGDSAPLLLALDARVRIAGAGGERVLPLDEFFIGYRKTALRAGEVAVSVVVPAVEQAFSLPWRLSRRHRSAELESPLESGDGMPEARRSTTAIRFFKVAKRRTDDISTVAACFALGIDGRGRIEYARVAYGGVAATPVRAKEAEAAIAGLRWNDSAVHVAQDVLARTLHPISDHRGSAAYRLTLAQNLIEKFWWEQQTEAAA